MRPNSVFDGDGTLSATYGCVFHHEAVEHPSATGRAWQKPPRAIRYSTRRHADVEQSFRVVFTATDGVQWAYSDSNPWLVNFKVRLFSVTVRTT
jgi:hypothetical protein